MKNADKVSKINNVVNCFITNPNFTMVELSNNTGVSKSTVQRMLSNPEYSDIVIPSTGRTIKEQLEYNLIMGRRKGGRNSFQNNSFTKDENGKFSGSTRREQESNNELTKQEDIKLIVDFFCKNPNSTLDYMASTLSLKTNKQYTRDYVYNCLLDPRVEEMFGMLIKCAISNQLSNNNQGFFKKFGTITFDIKTLSSYNLSDEEISVILYRFNGGIVRSTSDAALHFNCSKTTITNIENRALEKIKQTKKDEDQKKL